MFNRAQGIYLTIKHGETCGNDHILTFDDNINANYCNNFHDRIS